MMIRHIFLRYFLAIFLMMLCVHGWAQEQSFAGLVLDEVPANQSDMESVKRGAKFFATTCMSCHTLIYLRYNKLAQEAGVTYDKMPINVKNWPNGVTPPDLSLEADIRGVDWLYTYLHSFYTDPSRPTGANNLLVPGTAMPAILSPYQGIQVLIADKHPGDLFGQVQWYDLLKLDSKGSVSPEQFDVMVADIVNFLAYASAPYKAEQHKIGWWVLGFLVVLTVMMYKLKKEYWKDVENKQKEE